ncbi:MAG: amidohydrolase family protein, partial [Actinomycetota bacterium]|nr:amidohydrolase family protein [Actinomycetota bacterium]
MPRRCVDSLSKSDSQSTHLRVWWAQRAWLPGGVAEGVLLRSDGDRLESVTPGVDPPADAVRLPGLVLPGLTNAHGHAFHRALRGRTEVGSGDFWSWRSRMYELAERLDPDGYHALARAVYAEMALAGATSVGEFHYLHHAAGGRPYAEPNAMGAALAAAADEAGLRLTLVDTCYLRGGFDTPLDGPQLRFADADADAWARRASDAAAGQPRPLRPPD